MSENILQDRISSIETVFDAEKLISRNADAKNEIAKYYRLNRITYKLINSKDGFVHMGITRDGVFKKSDFLEHAKIISGYIDRQNSLDILEPATGKGATVKYLAKQYPTKSFSGLDLPNGQLKTHTDIPNLTLHEGDYHDLGQYDDESFDLVYIVEALCHATSKKKVISEVCRVLRPGGVFIVFDGYASKPRSAMTAIEQKASDLTYASMMVRTAGHHYEDFRSHVEEEGMTVVKEEDLSDYVLPSMKRLESRAAKYFKHPRIAKLFNTIIPEEVTANAVAAYLMPMTVELGLHRYWMTVAKKK